MNDLDRQIEEALDAEDKQLLKQYGEQGLLAQSFSVFQGKQGWIAAIATFMSFLLFLGFLYTAWRFFQASDPLFALRWAAGGVILVTMVGFVKIWFWMRMESNRIIREVKRLELQIARTQSR